MVTKIRVVVLVGKPCSGKTTYALSNCFNNFVYISSHRYETDEVLFHKINDELDSRNNIIIDGDFGTVSQRSFITKLINDRNSIPKKSEISIECHHLSASNAECKKNGIDRGIRGGRRLNKAKLIDYMRNHETPTTEEGFDLYVQVPYKALTLNQNRCLFFNYSSLAYSSVGDKSIKKPEDAKLYACADNILMHYHSQGYYLCLYGRFSLVKVGKMTISTAQDCLLYIAKMLSSPIEHIHLILDDDNDGLFDFINRCKISVKDSILVGDSAFAKKYAERYNMGRYYHRNYFFDPKNQSNLGVPATISKSLQIN